MGRRDGPVGQVGSLGESIGWSTGRPVGSATVVHLGHWRACATHWNVSNGSHIAEQHDLTRRASAGHRQAISVGIGRASGGIVGHRGQTGAKPVAIRSKGQCRSCSAKRTWDASMASDERPNDGHRKTLKIRPITSLYTTKTGFRRERGAQVRPRWAGPPDHVLEFYCRPVLGRIEVRMPRPCDARERSTPLNACWTRASASRIESANP